MRIALIVPVALLASLVSAQATIAFSCDGEDASAKFQINGAYGTSVGSGLANFGGDLEILLADAPKDIRKIKLDRKLVVQQWFVGRDMRFAAIGKAEALSRCGSHHRHAARRG